MESRFHGLPPLKRFRLMQQELEESNIDKHQESKDNLKTPLCLPAKKRKESRDSPPCLPNSTTTVATYGYRLPAKKRVYAIEPFDLNVEYTPYLDAEKQENQQKDVQGGTDDEVKHVEVENKDEEEDNEESDDDGIVCAICDSTDGDPKDPIVLCDGCDLMAHTTCYGHPFTKGVPEGEWFCAQCLENQKNANPKAFSCCLCPVIGGALKPTKDGKWAHVVCALFVPEVFFSDPEGREGIDCTKVPRWRWEKKCYICKTKNGCVIDCSEPKCPLAFHVTCGLKEELCIEYREGRNKGAIVAGFCRTHTDLWKKQEQTGKFKIVAREEEHKK
ncbi:RING/FYVE/PHD zinc finger superfamily protein [Abeliophyllum distichum]|uniref:RING/FYVE/PHD zinc finger superfamily protein n=1 Tax=Abeliophyllum distichum TaxID=126358 RepID=A0ABD1PW18_9LAMI